MVTWPLPNTSTARSQQRKYPSTPHLALPAATRWSTSGSKVSMWIPTASTPASRTCSSTARSSGGSNWTWMGRPDASLIAAAQRLMYSAPRSWRLIEPVVSVTSTAPS